jgi:hypothetical protein
MDSGGAEGALAVASLRVISSAYACSSVHAHVVDPTDT